MRMVQVAITATDSVTRSPSRFGGGKHFALVAAITAGLVFSASVRAAEYAVGIVTKGAFLLSETANVQREDLWVHGRVGYLPVGTRVYFEVKPKTLNNFRTGGEETYFLVHSSIGIGGLLREDRFIQVKDKPIAVVVSSYNIALHGPKPVKGKVRKLLDVGHYDGVYLEITGDVNSKYISAVLHRPNQSNDLPKKSKKRLPETEQVSLWQKYVEKGLVKVVKPQTVNDEIPPFPVWGEPEILGIDFIREALEKIDKKIDEYVGPNFLPDADAFQCLLKGKAELDLVFKLFSSGLSFRLDGDFKKQDHMFRLKRQVLEISNDERTYVMLKDVKCHGETPERLQKFTLQEGEGDTKKRDYVRLKDWQERPSQWIVSLSGNDAPFRMIRIDGESAYQTALRRIDSFVQRGNSFIGKLRPEEKRILLNLILREIASFEDPELVQSQG